MIPLPDFMSRRQEPVSTDPAEMVCVDNSFVNEHEPRNSAQCRALMRVKSVV